MDASEDEDDHLDLNAPFSFDDEDSDNSKLQEVSEETKKLLERACLKQLSNSTRLQTRNPYPLPKVTATRCPSLDSYLKAELSSQVKNSDKELAKIQAVMLDAMGPLTSILEGASSSEGLDFDVAVNATKAALQLVGNASAKLSHLRRKRVVAHLSPALLPLVEEESNFKEAPPALFGTEFAKKSKDHVDQMKAMRSTYPKQRSGQKEASTFFRRGPPSSRGGWGRDHSRGGSSSRGTGRDRYFYRKSQGGAHNHPGGKQTQNK